MDYLDKRRLQLALSIITGREAGNWLPNEDYALLGYNLWDVYGPDIEPPTREEMLIRAENILFQAITGEEPE